MNKIIPLLFAGLFFIGIVVILAAFLWFSSAPTGEAPSLASTASPPSNTAPDRNQIPQWNDFDAANAKSYTIICLVNAPNGDPINNASAAIESVNENSYSHTARTDASGQCRLLVLQEGPYLLTVSARGFSSTKEPVTISPISKPEQTRILTLQYPTYTLKGQILSHAGVAVQNATVQCIAPANPQNGVTAQTPVERVAKSQRNGSFVFEGLHPGDYSLSAKRDGYLDESKTVRVSQNQFAILRLDAAARLNGLVKDEWNRPIAYADVSIQSDGPYGKYMTSSQSEANGRFTVYNLPPQQTTVTVMANGYQTLQKTFEIERSIHNIELIPTTAHLSVSGYVVDARTQNPLSNVALEIVDRRIGESNPVIVKETASGDDGSFAFSDLLPANYTIQLPEREQKRFPAQTVELPISFDNVEGVTIEIQKYASVSGRVVDEQGAPIANAEVEIILQSPLRSTVRTDESGQYEFPYLSIQRQTPPSGKALARTLASHPNYAPGFSDRFEFANGERIENVDVVLGKGITIQGKVTTEQYRPIAGARVFARLYEGRGAQRETVADENGNYRIERFMSAAPPEAQRGTHQITLKARADGFEYQLQSAPINGAEVVTENFILRDAGNLSGTVLLPDGTPAPGAKLMLMGAWIQKTESDAEGRFSFDNVREKSTLQIIAQYGQSNYRSPQKLLLDRNILGAGAYFAYAIPIEPNDNNIVIVLQPENGVVGTVTDGETNEPITDFKATLDYYFPQYDKYLNWSIREGTWSVPSPGAFGFSAPIQGEYLLTVEAEGYVPARFEIPFREAGSTKTLDVQLTQSGKGSVLGKIAPYDFHGNIKRLQLIGQGVDWPLHLITDRTAPNTQIASFQVDNVPPGTYEIVCIFTVDGNERRESLLQFEVDANNAVDVGVLDVSSIHVAPTPWPTVPR